MRKEKYIWISILIALLSILIFMSTAEIGKSKVCFFEYKCVNVEIADDFSERQTGLMFVSSLNEDEGMFFIFEKKDEHSFWMKNTLIPLDIIWIDREFEVVDIQSVFPCSEEPCEIFTPNKDAKYVLEVNYGFAEDNNIKIGSKLSHTNF